MGEGASPAGSRPGTQGSSRPGTKGSNRPATHGTQNSSKSKPDSRGGLKKERKVSVTGFWEKEKSGMGDGLVDARGFRREAATAQVRIARMIAAAKQIADLAEKLASETPEKDPAASKSFLHVTFDLLNVQDTEGRHLFGGVKVEQAPFLKVPTEEYSGAISWELSRLHRGLAVATDVCQRLDTGSITPMQLGFLRDDLYGMQRVQVGPHSTFAYGILADAEGFKDVLAGAQVLQGLKASDPDEIRAVAKSLLSRGAQQIREDVVANLEVSFRQFRNAEKEAHESRCQAVKNASDSAERPRTPTIPAGLLTTMETNFESAWIPPKRKLRATKSAAELSMRPRHPNFEELAPQPLLRFPSGPWPFPHRAYGGTSSSEANH